MKNTKYVLFILILMMAILPLSMVLAQDEPPSEDSLIRSISLGSEAMIISSPTNDTDYLIHVNLPIGYKDNASQPYPVLYLFDPWYTFGTVTDQVKLLSYYGGFPDIITVGVGYSDMIEFSGQSKLDLLRGRDLCTDEQPQPFLDFLTETLILYIDSTYNAEPNDRTIMGHSCGGDFALYAFVHAQGTFHRFVASSPGTGSPKRPVCINCELENRTDISGILFLSSGEFEAGSVIYIEDAFSTLQDLSDTNLNLTVSMEIFDDTDHLTVVPFALSRGLMSVFCGSGDLGSCQSISTQPINDIEDMDFPLGETFAIPDTVIRLRSYPERYAERAGTCQDMEATVLRAVEYVDGSVWIQLQCGDNTGWVQKTQLED